MKINNLAWKKIDSSEVMAEEIRLLGLKLCKTYEFEGKKFEVYTDGAFDYLFEISNDQQKGLTIKLNRQKRRININFIDKLFWCCKEAEYISYSHTIYNYDKVIATNMQDVIVMSYENKIIAFGSSSCPSIKDNNILYIKDFKSNSYDKVTDFNGYSSFRSFGNYVLCDTLTKVKIYFKGLLAGECSQNKNYPWNPAKFVHNSIDDTQHLIIWNHIFINGVELKPDIYKNDVALMQINEHVAYSYYDDENMMHFVLFGVDILDSKNATTFRIYDDETEGDNKIKIIYTDKHHNCFKATINIKDMKERGVINEVS